LAAVGAILNAIARTLWRDLRSVQAIQGNNFFWLIALIMYQQPGSGLFPLVILVVLVILPFTAEPLRKIPPERLALWPLSAGQRIALRVGGILLSPIAWIAAAILIWTGKIEPAVTIIAAAIIFGAISVRLKRLRARVPQSNLLRLVPSFRGSVGHLFRKDLRQMLCTLDPYIALLLAVSAWTYRLLATAPEPAAFPVLSVMVALALSTYAQSLFGLDAEPGMMRYRLMPIRGWQLLVSKDLAFMGILGFLVLPLSPLTGIAAGLAALVAGRHHSLAQPSMQPRWRLTSGVLFPIGFVQMLCMVITASAVNGASAYWFLGALLLYAASLWWHGREWDCGSY
jgi:hypothetical protein